MTMKKTLTIWSALRAAANSTGQRSRQAQAIIEAADSDSDLEAALKSFENTEENRKWIESVHADIALENIIA